MFCGLLRMQSVGSLEIKLSFYFKRSASQLDVYRDPCIPRVSLFFLLLWILTSRINRNNNKCTQQGHLFSHVPTLIHLEKTSIRLFTTLTIFFLGPLKLSCKSKKMKIVPSCQNVHRFVGKTTFKQILTTKVLNAVETA